MSHRFQLILSDRQYAFLNAEADRSSVPVAELVRRAIDTTYGLSGTKKIQLVTHTTGRRSGVPVAD